MKEKRREGKEKRRERKEGVGQSQLSLGRTDGANQYPQEGAINQK